jgi:hypothetical protein
MHEDADADQGLAGWMRIGFADVRLNPVQRYIGGGRLPGAMRIRPVWRSAGPSSAIRSVAAPLVLAML